MSKEREGGRGRRHVPERLDLHHHVFPSLLASGRIRSGGLVKHTQRPLFPPVPRRTDRAIVFPPQSADEFEEDDSGEDLLVAGSISGRPGEKGGREGRGQTPMRVPM